MHTKWQSTPCGGPLQSVRTASANILGLLRTRLELVATELQEEKARFKDILLLAIAGVFCAIVGVLLLTLFVVAWFWDTPYRMHALGGAALLYLLLSASAALLIRKKAKEKPRLFDSTLSELEKDRQQLLGS